MRLKLAGSLSQPKPLSLSLVNGTPFIPATYIDMGYTDFDVICIGAGGGRGGGIDTANSGTLIRSYGGAGGGGGLQRVKGLLSALPVSCPVLVGVPGVVGTEHVSNPALTTDGTDGGYSAFNGTTCRASGGKGGKRVQSNSVTVTTQANGGEGGVGGSTIPGGGAAGGVAGTPSGTGPGTLGTTGFDGSWTGIIGKGGGGGAGGVGKYGGVALDPATDGGRGSYNPGDLIVYGPGEAPTDDLVTNSPGVIPGKAGGAKASPLNKLPYIYGKSGEAGAVVIRLIAVL